MDKKTLGFGAFFLLVVGGASFAYYRFGKNSTLAKIGTPVDNPVDNPVDKPVDKPVETPVVVTDPVITPFVDITTVVTPPVETKSVLPLNQDLIDICDKVIADINDVDNHNYRGGGTSTDNLGNVIYYQQYLAKVKSYGADKRKILINIINEIKKPENKFLEKQNVLPSDLFNVPKMKDFILDYAIKNIGNAQYQAISNYYVPIPAITNEYFPGNKYWGL